MTEQQMLQVYGMNEEDIQVYYMDSITAKFSGLEMVVAGILSDCQEMMSYTNAASYQSTEEAVRKQLNVAKYILGKIMQDKREVLVNSQGEEI